MRVDSNEVVRRLKENGFRVRQTARELGISHSTVSRWWYRAKSGYGYVRHTGLERQRTAPVTRRATDLPKLGRRPHDLEELNARYQTWLAKYNTYRPHLSLDLMTPEQKLHSFQVA